MVDRAFSVRLAAETAAYEQAMGRAEQATRRVGESGEKSGSLIERGMGAGVQAVAKATTVAAAGATILTGAIIKAGTSYNTLEQQSRAALTTILGSKDAAAAMMDTLGEFTKTSPFPRQAFIQGQQQLLAFGMEAEKIVPTMSAVQDAVAAAGGSSQAITEVIDVLAKVQSSGRFTAQTLNQLGFRGIDAAKLIGEQFGLTAGEMRQAITDGTYDAGELLDALTTQMTATFGGAAENVKETWIGAKDRIAAAFRDISSIIMEPFVSKAGGGAALDWANGIADAMRAIERQVGPLSIALVNQFGGSLDAITDKIGGLQPAIDNFDLGVITGNLDGLVAYAPLVGAVGAALVTMGTNSLPILSSLGIAGINPVVAGLATLVALHPGLRATLGDFLADLQPLLPVLANTATNLLDAGVAIIDALLPGLDSILGAVAPAAVALGTTLGGSAVIAAEALVPIAEAVSAVLEIVGKLPTPIVTAALAFGAFKGLNLGGLLTPLRGISEQMALQRSLAGMAGTQVGIFGGALGTAAVGAQRLGGALKVAFMTNPIGIAIAGLTTVVGLFASSQSDTKVKVDELTRSLDEQTGAITDLTREKLAARLADEGWAESYADMGGSVRDLMLILEGDVGALERFNRVLDESDRAAARASGGYLTGSDKAHGLRRAIEGMQGQLELSGQAWATEQTLLGDTSYAADEAAAAMDSLGLGMQLTAVDAGELAGAVDGLPGPMSEAEKAAEEMWEAYQKLIEQNAGYSQSFVQTSDTISAVQAAMRTSAEGTAQAQRDLATETEGALGNAEASWEDYYDGVKVNLALVNEELASQIEAQSNWQSNLVALIGTVPDAMLDHLYSLGTGGAPLIQAMIDDPEEAAKYIELWSAANELELGAGGARGAAAFGQGFASSFEDMQAIANAADAVGTKTGKNFTAKMMEEVISGELTIQGAIDKYDLEPELSLDADPAAQILAEQARAIEETVAFAKMNLDAALAIGVRTGFVDDTEGTVPVIPLSAEDRLAVDRVDGFVHTTEDRKPVIKVDADLTNATTAYNTWFTTNSGKTIKVGMSYSVNSGGGYANGGFIERADGGFDQHGNHVPRQSMMGGPQYGRTNILWGEPETGWEAYISGKPGQERRNRRILEQAAHKMGMTVLDGLGTQTIHNANGRLMDATMEFSGAPSGDGGIEKVMQDWAEHNPLAAGSLGMGWRAQWNIIKSLVPSAILTSAYRPGAITSSGYRSYHGRGRAIDLAGPMGQIFSVLRRAFPQSRELYYSPAGLMQLQNGRPHYPTGITRAQHWDHVHWAMNKGGILDAVSNPKAADTGQVTLDPGWNTVWNGLGRLEHLTEQRFATSAPPTHAAQSGGGDFTTLAATVAQLSATVAAFPDRIEVPVTVDGERIALATRSGERDLGPQAAWVDAAQVGR